MKGYLDQNIQSEGFVVSQFEDLLNWARASSLWPMSFGLACWSSFTFNISQYRLMLANMTKTEFNPVGLENIFQCIPLFVNLTCSNKLERVALEPLANKICLVFMFVLFDFILAPGGGREPN